MYGQLYAPPPNGHPMNFIPPAPGGPYMPPPLDHMLPVGPDGLPFPLGSLPPNGYPIPMPLMPPQSPATAASLPPPPPQTLPPPQQTLPLSTPLPQHPPAPTLEQPPGPAKRTHEDDDEDGEQRELVDPDEPFKWNCNQVRTRIRNWIDNGGMKVTEFQKAIGVNSNAYRNFMAQNGPFKGVNSSVYSAAYFFFRDMEERGEKIPRKKAKTNADGSVAPATTSTKTPTPRSRGKTALTDFGDIKLDGEDEGEVKIYDTCDEVRKKINAYLQTPGITQASFLKDIAAQVGEGINIQGKQLTDFRTKKGPDAGNTSRVYYGSYLFFEKLRIRDGKPKSKHRCEMEKIWKNGMDRTTANKGIWLHTSEYATKDKYGQFHIHKRA